MPLHGLKAKPFHKAGAEGSSESGLLVRSQVVTAFLEAMTPRKFSLLSKKMNRYHILRFAFMFFCRIK